MTERRGEEIWQWQWGMIVTDNEETVEPSGPQPQQESCHVWLLYLSYQSIMHSLCVRLCSRSTTHFRKYTQQPRTWQESNWTSTDLDRRNIVIFNYLTLNYSRIWYVMDPLYLTSITICTYWKNKKKSVSERWINFSKIFYFRPAL